MRAKALLFVLSATFTSTLLVGCTNNETKTPSPSPSRHGKTVLCNTEVGSLTASVTITNLYSNQPQQTTIEPFSTAADVCTVINAAAYAAGLTTNYSEKHSTGFDIFAPLGHDQAKYIGIVTINLTLDLQDF